MYTVFIFLFLLLALCFFCLTREKRKIDAYVAHNIAVKVKEARDFLDFTLTEQDDTYLVYNIGGLEWRLSVSPDDYTYAVFREENDEPVEAYVSKDLRKIRWFLNTRTGTVFE